MNYFLAFVFLFINSLLNKNQVPAQPTHSESEEFIPCPRCGSVHTVKNGSIHNGKPKRHCKNCKRQFVVNPTNHSVSLERKHLIDKLLLERISLRGIVRVTGVSFSWLQNYVNCKFGSIPQQIKVSDKPKGRLTIECDEMWSFFVTRKNYSFIRYIWLAIDRDTREIVGCYIGDRTRKSARKLWG